ncbi:metallophosphoesterase family protein [Corynebacterium kalidii]|uniref:Metallophosphoesterase n=1 Tax=Corynebacterium kalidii TaxID=2931982 RepID=A0A9X1WMU4_9CORY|nr:metallophosphoesterase [Corynebacterium kalidii]MCJ7859517.1 metallophosphoesterase [Corynebacterium kalidii]
MDDDARPLTAPDAGRRTLWAVSDLHVAARGNRDLVDRGVRPANPGDWLIVAGDVAERTSTILDTLRSLAERFAQVIWAPGNHELFSRAADDVHAEDKYDELVKGCQSMGVLTPEDPYPRFAGRTIVPMFTLYDHSWRDPLVTVERALSAAEGNGVVFTDQVAIAPYVDVPLWCQRRLGYTVRRLSKVSGPTVLVNHWPLVREVTARLRLPEVALWSGTRHTQDWPVRFGAETVIYGHLHIPVVTEVDGVRHVEVSLGYPRERERTLDQRRERNLWPYPVLTEPAGEEAG